MARTTNDLEDSPIIRISQDTREVTPNSRLNADLGDAVEKITNIRVFKELDVDEKPDEPNELSTDRKDAIATPPFSYVTEESLSSKNLVLTTESNELLDGNVSRNSTTETNAVTVESVTPSTELSGVTESVGTTLSSAAPILEETQKPVRRKVLRRKRPVASSSTVSTRTSGEEKNVEDGSQAVKRRKIVRRLRPFAKESTSTEGNRQSDEAEQRRLRTRLFSRSRAGKSYSGASEFPEADRDEESGEIKIDTTRRPFTIIVESPAIDESSEEATYEDDLHQSTPEVERSTLSDLTIGFSDESNEALTTLLPTTLLDSQTDQPEVTEAVANETEDKSYTETDATLTTEASVTYLTTEATTATEDSAETETSGTDSPMATTLELQATTVPTTVATDATSRFIRKKFIRKRPSSSTPSTARRFAIPRSQNRVLPVQQDDIDHLSNRRKNLFVRRRPVQSTTVSTTALEEEEADDFHDHEEVEDATTKSYPVSSETGNSDAVDEVEDFWKRYTTPPTTASATLSAIFSRDFEQTFETPGTTVRKYFNDYSSEETIGDLEDEEESGKEEPVEINYRRPDQRPKFQVPQSLKRGRTTSHLAATTQIPPSTRAILDSSPEESAEPKLNEEARKFKIIDYRQPRTRFENAEDDVNTQDEPFPNEDFAPKFRLPIANKDRVNPENTELTSAFWLTQNAKNRVYPKRTSSTTEQTVTETLIPAKKFDYVADAMMRKQQSQRTTARYEATSKMASESRTSGVEDENFVETDFTTPSSKPQITRLVTSVVESGTTERQIIHIKTKYSSLTSTTRIPVQTTHSLNDRRTKDATDEFYNEIRESTERPAERSTLSIESEFAARNRFTTEPTAESSTIEIESVFSNLIAADSRT